MGELIKQWNIIIIIIILTLSACTQINTAVFQDFTHPEPDIYVKLMPIVREYFYYRKGAVLSGDLATFYLRYPELEKGINLDSGINFEAHLVESLQSLHPFDGDIHPEYYEKIKVKDLRADPQILVHGMELYLWQDADGTFNETGGEFILVLLLQEKEDIWQIVQTNEVTLAEWKGFDL